MISGIYGQFLEVTVVSCSKLKDTQLIGWQDPFLCIGYSDNQFRTKTCTDGGKNPTFNEKFQISLIEGIHELTINAWNDNTFSNTFIGGGRVQLRKVLSEGYDDNPWMLQTHSGKFAGEAKLILHYANARVNHHMPTTPSHVHGPPPGAYGAYPYQMHPPPQPAMYPPSGYPPVHQPYQMHPPAQLAMYPPSGYPPAHQPYIPQPHRPEAYPPQPHMHYHPSPQHGQSYYPPGPSTAYYPPPYG